MLIFIDTADGNICPKRVRKTQFIPMRLFGEDSDDDDVSHLVLVVHGIGQALQDNDIEETVQTYDDNANELESKLCL